MRPDPQARLVRALLAKVDGARLVTASSRDWTSATFTGARHQLQLHAPAPAARALLDDLRPETILLPGQLVADILVTAEGPAGPDMMLRVDALTLDAR